MVEYYSGEPAFSHVEMNDPRKMWLIYCGHDYQDKDGDAILQQLGYTSSSVYLGRMDIVTGKRLWDQIVDKVSELKLCSWDACIFLVSRDTLAGEAYLEEQAYALDQAGKYPKGILPCVGLMYL